MVLRINCKLFGCEGLGLFSAAGKEGDEWNEMALCYVKRSRGRDRSGDLGDDGHG